jgi:cytoskeletal protein RodZ
MTPPLQPPQGRASGGSPGGIAERLRRAREERGLSLDELSVKTRIPTRHLETIEAGRGAELPGGFIGGSFVRQYAQAVGMDGEQVLREFTAQTGLSLDVPFEERKVSPYTPESIQKFHAQVWRNVGISAAGLLLLVLAIAYFLTRREPNATAPAPPQPRPLPAYLEPEPADVPIAEPAPTRAAGTNAAATAGVSSASAASPATVVNSSRSTSRLANPSATAALPAAPATAVAAPLAESKTIPPEAQPAATPAPGQQ